MGRILKVNTYVLQIIWTKAWLIDTKSKAFNTFMEKIYRYIHEGYNKKHAYETVAKQREEGGLNLINVKERIETIKAQLLLETEHQTPESDNLIYNIGIKKTKNLTKHSKAPKD